MDLLVVGGGLTGALTASLLKKSTKALTISIWEKAKGAGGRMTTRRNPNDPSSFVDMGAQYFSRNKLTGESEEFESLRNSLYDELISQNILIPYQGVIDGEKTNPSILNYVAPKGANSITKHFLEKSEATVMFNRRFSNAKFEVSDPKVKKIVCGCHGEPPSLYDGLILTLPVPQLLQLQGDVFESMDEDIHSNLSSVKYSSRYAIGLFYDECVDTAWSSKYINDPNIAFASWNTAKRGDVSSRGTLSVHSTQSFGRDHMEDDREVVKALMIEHTNRMFPGLPTPTYSYLLPWRYSQVTQAYPGEPGCVVLSHDPLVVATGDGFIGSNYESCVKCALATSNTVLKHLNRV